MQQISWEDLNKYISDLSYQIISSGFNPTILIAIARGGWIPTRLLSDALGVKKIASIGLTYDDKERTKLNFYSVPTPINNDERCLVIEDKLETGKSMLESVHFLASKKSLVKTASLFITRNSIIIPDYYLAIIDEETIFPWE